MLKGNPFYDFDLAVDRIRASVDAARSLSEPFVLCARADGVMNGTYDTAEAIRRIQAFEQAGADLLYVPSLPGVSALERIVASVTKPVNALAIGALSQISVDQFSSIGVRRISVGSAIARLTHGLIWNSVRAMLDDGEFKTLKNAANSKEIDQLLIKGEG